MKKLFLLLFFIPTLLFAKEIFVINENTLKDLMNENVPSIEKINSLITQSNFNRNKYNEKFSPFVNAGFGYSNVNGDFYDSYSGNFYDPYKKFNIGLNQNLPAGISYSLGMKNGFAKSYSYANGNGNNYFQYDTSAEAKISFDLWKNLLGITDISKRLSLKLNEDEILEQANLEKTKFFNEIRKIYWGLNLNNSLKNIYERLIKQAEIQAKNVEKMYNSSVADKGDLARAKAVVNIRKSDLLLVKYNIKKLKQNLSNLIPELNDKELKIDFSTYEKTKNRIKSCLNSIGLNTDIPFNLTSYSTILGYKDKRIKEDLKSLKRYSGPDIKLDISATSLGFGDINKDSIEDMTNVERRDYTIGLNFSMPFGKTYSKSKEDQVKLAKMQYNYEKKEIISNLTSFYNYFFGSINGLISVKNEQEQYRDNLRIRVETMRKKYNQGRISLSELIQDEDSLFESELMVVRTKYNIINLLLDYLSIFNKTECEFNL